MFDFVGTFFQKIGATVGAGLVALGSFFGAVPENPPAELPTPIEETVSTQEAEQPASPQPSAPESTLPTITKSPVIDFPAQTIGEPQQEQPKITLPTYTAPTAPTIDKEALKKQERMEKIVSDCNSRMNELNQEISNLKDSYYKQLPGILSSGTSVVAQGNADRLLDETNRKISLINLEIEKIYLDCQNQISALQ